ncbi:MAG: hypothetical protein KDD25_10310, partial [Bdellovibrionales bacterium]|nr:hypothetical protein [Bdellovibrionales bacterium]
FMKQEAYPAIKSESRNRSGGEHIEAVKSGEGVEIRLTDDVSTYHVKFKAAEETDSERSGRSFSAVGKGPRVQYVADASYKHYLTSIDKLFSHSDDEEIAAFYRAILKVIANCDASGVEQLDTHAKEVAADFVAVYVAEQYRHMISGRGKLGRSHNWDDAHLQVTLLAAFHSGQNESASGMFYEGRFTDEVYNQINKVDGESLCVYKQSRNPARDELRKRSINMTDYWQFNSACERSGVNLTRRDFTKMGEAITAFEKSENTEVVYDVAALIGKSSRNIVEGVAEFFIDNGAPTQLGSKSDEIVDAVVDFLMATRKDAVEITNELL